MSRQRRTSQRYQITQLAVGSFNALIVAALLLMCSKISLPVYASVVVMFLSATQIGISFIFFFYPLGSILIPSKDKKQDAKATKA